jgi:hypothetical protein
MELNTTREATNCTAIQIFLAFYGTRRFNTEFTRDLHLFLSLARPIQSTSPHPTSPRSILILSTHLRICLPTAYIPSGFLTTNLYAFLFSPIHVTSQMNRESETGTSSVGWTQCVAAPEDRQNPVSVKLY